MAQQVSNRAASILGGLPDIIRAAILSFQIGELRNRILFTLGILVAFRLLSHITVPGVDLVAFRGAFENNALLGVFDIFSGGALRNLSIASLGVFPYITASIIMQILTPFVPFLKSKSQEGAGGRAAINRYTHYLTVPLAFGQAWAQLNVINTLYGTASISNFGFATDPFNTMTILIMMAGSSILLVWLGELVTEKGIGNGISLIIFAGIVTNIPTIIAQLWNLRDQTFQVLLLVALYLGIILLVVFITEAQRRIPVQYGRNVFRSGRMYRQTGASFLPLRVNAAGMIPLIMAFTIITLPSTVASYFSSPAREGAFNSFLLFIVNNFSPTSWLYWILLFFLVVIFTFIYTLVVYSQQNIAGNLQKNGGFIPGIRPGPPTHNHLMSIILRITWGGAFMLGFIAITPWFAQLLTNIDINSTVAIIQSTSILIMVGVALDTLRQLESQLLMRNYEGFVS